MLLLTPPVEERYAPPSGGDNAEARPAGGTGHSIS